MSFNDGQGVMEGQSSHLSIPEAHNVTQHQSVRILSFLTTNVEGLQLTQTERQLTGWMPKAFETASLLIEG